MQLIMHNRIVGIIVKLYFDTISIVVDQHRSHKFCEIPTTSHVLKHRHLTYLFAGQQRKDRFRTSQIAKNQLPQHKPKLIHWQNHKSFDALRQHLEVRKLRGYLTNGLYVLSVDILSVDSFEIICEDIENLQFVCTVTHQCLYHSVTLGL